ncbi:peptidase M28 [Sphingomonas sp. Leaf412]|uniref:M28 family peptidase n=1 Tax=Sphingomonas sp. Leaf412 TaxID=1736370 RepID=UPI0006F687D2|nr:M28 family peptidase [Sphingomonas sp. Leaf412]KQT35119.1 peptidase M28 [Sphingomonas sp. Leaf412]
MIRLAVLPPLAALLLAAADPAPPLLSPARIKADIAVLASDEYKGRGPAQAGEAPTLALLEKRFRDLGLTPQRQAVPMVRLTRTAARFSLNKAVLTPGKEIAATSGIVGTTDLAPTGIVFVGYGMTDPKLGYDPYAGVDVKGKVVLALAGDPDSEAGHDLGFGGRALAQAARGKAAEAWKRGAAAFLTLHEDFAASYPWLQRASSDPAPAYRLDDGTDPPAFGIRGSLREDIGRRLLTDSGIDLDREKVAARAPAWRARPLAGATFAGHVETVQDRVVSHNVVAVLPGTDPAAGSILYGAHWDAYGDNAWDPPADRIRNGAVDNATGTATLLEVARAFATGPRPRRSVVFGLWTAEEKGLLGAYWYAAHPLLPLATTAAQFNLDPHVVFPRTRTLELIGPGRTPLEAELTRVAAAQGLAVVPEENSEAGWYFRSDHLPFAEKGVPGVYFRAGRDLVTGGRAAGEAWRARYNARCYHQPCDEYDPRWDLTGAAQEGSVALALGREIAGSTRWPGWNAGSPYATVRAASDAERR